MLYTYEDVKQEKDIFFIASMSWLTWYLLLTVEKIEVESPDELRL